MDRRTFIAILGSLPVVPALSFDGIPQDDMVNVNFERKYLREKRWDIMWYAFEEFKNKCLDKFGPKSDECIERYLTSKNKGSGFADENSNSDYTFCMYRIDNKLFCIFG